MILGDNEQVVCSCDLTYVKMAIIFFLCMQIPDMLSSRGSHACAVLDDKLYAIGGYAALKPLVCVQWHNVKKAAKVVGSTAYQLLHAYVKRHHKFLLS